MAFSGILALNYGWAAFTLSRPDAQEKDHEQQMADLVQYGSPDHYDRALSQLLVGVRAAAG